MQSDTHAYSCKARGLCPSCGKRRAIEWAERMVEEVLPEVPYVPLVFTIPKIIRPAFLYDRRLYGALVHDSPGTEVGYHSGFANRS